MSWKKFSLQMQVVLQYGQMPFSGTTSASGIVWGAQNYISKFGVWGNGLINSQVFDDGINVGIWTSSPTYKLTVAW
jgi:hypothetical protein